MTTRNISRRFTASQALEFLEGFALGPKKKNCFFFIYLFFCRLTREQLLTAGRVFQKNLSKTGATSVGRSRRFGSDFFVKSAIMPGATCSCNGLEGLLSLEGISLLFSSLCFTFHKVCPLFQLEIEP